MIIQSDWHIHSEYSYDARNTLEEIANGARDQGLCRVGITDHVNWNDASFFNDLHRSAEAVNAARANYPFMVLGTELTPIEKPEFDYIAKHGTREGYQAPAQSKPYDIELAVTKQELIALGVRYGIGAAHWRVDVPKAARVDELSACIKEWHRQQLWLACDERVTILGHPWYHGYGIWYQDFTVIPHSANEEITAALKENGKYVECNSHFFTTPKASEKFRRQYAEYLREMFEMGIPVTYGSDSHGSYSDVRPTVEAYLRAAGFAEGDLSELDEAHLWS